MQLSYDAVCFDLFGTLVYPDGHPIDGAARVLNACAASRYAIVTSCGRSTAFTLIARAGFAPPPVLVTSDDVERTKPSPQPYQLATQRLMVDPTQTLAVEDSHDGVRSARDAGLDVLAVGAMRPPSSALFSIDRIARLRVVSADANGITFAW